MPYTVQYIQSLPETQLHTVCLIPLLKAMGYQGVEHYHGTTERGKDIVCYITTLSGARENTAIVAKRGKISASVSKDVAEVQTQINQAFGSTFTDGLTGVDCDVHKVIVAASGTISHDAREAILCAVNPVYKRHVEFWEGDTLVDLLNTHLPEGGIVQDILSIGRRLNDLEDIDVRPRHLPGGNVKFEVFAKKPGVTFANVVFSFPDTPEGNEARERFERFVNDGHAVTIGREFITEFEQHAELVKLFGDETPPFIAMEAVVPDVRLPVDISVEHEEESFSYQGVALKLQRRGEKTIELSTIEGESPIQLRLRISSSGKVQMNLGFKIEGHPALSALKAVRLWEALAQGRRVEIKHSDTGLHVLSTSELPQIEAPPAELIELMEDLNFLQERTPKPLLLPDIIVSQLAADAAALRRVYEAGVFTEPLHNLTGTLETGGAEAMLSASRPGEARKIALVNEDSSVEVCGVTFETGRTVIIAEPVVFTKRAYKKLERSVKRGNDEHEFEVRALPECKGIKHYFPQFLSGQALTDYNRVYGDVPKHELPSSSDSDE